MSGLRRNKDGSSRRYLHPRQDDCKHGWATVRLHDRRGVPIRDPVKAAEAYRAGAAIYTAWCSERLGGHALSLSDDPREFFGKVRLCYDSVDHPGFVPPEGERAGRA